MLCLDCSHALTQILTSYPENNLERLRKEIQAALSVEEEEVDSEFLDLDSETQEMLYTNLLVKNRVIVTVSRVRETVSTILLSQLFRRKCMFI